jgi:hypothetical protein
MKPRCMRGVVSSGKRLRPFLAVIARPSKTSLWAGSLLTSPLLTEARWVVYAYNAEAPTSRYGINAPVPNVRVRCRKLARKNSGLSDEFKREPTIILP